MHAARIDRGLAIWFDDLDADSAAAQVGSFLEKHGYSLSDGLPHSGLYAKGGSDLARRMTGSIRMRYEFSVTVDRAHDGSTVVTLTRGEWIGYGGFTRPGCRVYGPLGWWTEFVSQARVENETTRLIDAAADFFETD